MRKWIIVAALALVLGGGLWVATANLDAWLNENRAWVGEQLSAALGRDVSFGEVGISLRSGLGVRARDLRIGEDPAFSKQDFVQAEAVDVRVKLLPALFGEIQVARVVLRSPSVSRKHARISLEDGQWVVTDQGSSNGVVVDGQRVERAELSEGMVFKLGDLELRCGLRPLHRDQRAVHRRQ